MEPAYRQELLGPLGVNLVGFFRRKAKRFVELQEFARCEIAPCSRRDACERDGSNADATKLDDIDSDGVHHLSHHMIKALVEHDLDDDAFLTFTKEPALIRDDPTPFHLDTIAQLLHLAIVRTLVRDNVIFLCQPVPWVHDPVCDFAIIGKQQETLRFAVQSTNGIDAFLDVDEIHDGPALLLVVDGCDETAGLIEDDEARLLPPDDLAINANLVPGRMNACSELGDRHAIDLDAAILDQVLGGPARSNAPCCEHALQAFSRWGDFVTVVGCAGRFSCHAQAAFPKGRIRAAGSPA